MIGTCNCVREGLFQVVEKTRQQAPSICLIDKSQRCSITGANHDANSSISRFGAGKLAVTEPLNLNSSVCFVVAQVDGESRAGLPPREVTRS
jgi:hypothetical protein